MRSASLRVGSARDEAGRDDRTGQDADRDHFTGLVVRDELRRKVDRWNLDSVAVVVQRDPLAAAVVEEDADPRHLVGCKAGDGRELLAVETEVGRERIP